MPFDTLLLGTSNAGKLREMRAILQPLGIQVLAPSEVGDIGPPPESGTTLEANALAKARYYFQWSGLPTLADDSGLEVDALKGAPGVQSAHLAGPQASDSENVQKLLHLLAGVADRRARFRTVLAFVPVQGREHLFEGVIEGILTTEPQGTHGFGYDPVFVPEGSDRTFAQMTLEEKNRFSHRRRALDAFIRFLKG
ncbi:MAG: RdgB/HAM1 family non-canonical purine NTP pyrophosphatase [Flavobacteriales bacterium]|nr:RdgB/HAM1 family non-canonical purine NTP pyrophosphatase [Flavobacteriales bacterium]MCX7769234.1 RdgB/HAM1 family non-canonical purine NTP pyrophosphatase [Flavobacteriales bacterium]MDW8410996.1 RdgB/HAM1 family non-canonical purine NTP pyrophosphatase [Flavobacteriales bacterium]